jgi:hypothetical protein
VAQARLREAVFSREPKAAATSGATLTIPDAFARRPRLHFFSEPGGGGRRRRPDRQRCARTRALQCWPLLPV